jgi:hypothetical protein
MYTHIYVHYIFNEIKETQNHILLRAKFVTGNVLCHLEEIAIWNHLESGKNYVQLE